MGDEEINAMKASKQKNDDMKDDIQKNVKQNIDLLYAAAGGTPKKFAQFVAKYLPRSVERIKDIVDNGTLNYNHTIPIERAFGLRLSSLFDPPDQFEKYFKTRLNMQISTPTAVIDSWSNTISFGEILIKLQPIFIYYWSYADKKVIANECEFNFTPESGIEFTFHNPRHPGRTDPTLMGTVPYSGHLYLIGKYITFQVYSPEINPEPLSGIGEMGSAPAIARGTMVGIQTDPADKDYVRDFRFIMVSNPNEKMQTTNRLEIENVIEPVLSYFRTELGID